MNLNKRVAVITGVSKGIGLATAQALLSKGTMVAGWSRSAPDLKHENFHFFETDVKSRSSVEQSYGSTVQTLGEVDILINNAGLGYTGLIEEIPVEQWEEMVQLNVNGLFYCTRLVVPAMKARGEGHIVNIASIAGLDGAPLFSGYCGTKFAVRGISRSMYKELRDYGVKVTSVGPGSVQTNFFDHIEQIQANENMMQADDIAGAIVYTLETSTNFHPVELEFRPLMPKGRKTK
ncbi:MAG: SDR family oxidoreductase [Cytophagaceae bacterium]